MLTREFIFFTQHLGRVQFQQDTNGVADTVKIGSRTEAIRLKTLRRPTPTRLIRILPSLSSARRIQSATVSGS